jgi:hypothetical protein
MTLASASFAASRASSAITTRKQLSRGCAASTAFSTASTYSTGESFFARIRAAAFTAGVNSRSASDMAAP